MNIDIFIHSYRTPIGFFHMKFGYDFPKVDPKKFQTFFKNFSNHLQDINIFILIIKIIPRKNTIVMLFIINIIIMFISLFNYQYMVFFKKNFLTIL